MANLMASSAYINWSSLGTVLLIGILAGAGAVALYSLGLVALSASGYMPSADAQTEGRVVKRNPLALVGGIVCLLGVAGIAVVGILEIFIKG